MQSISKHTLIVISIISYAPALRAAPEQPEHSAVHIEVGYYDNGQFQVVEEGSGFIVNAAGWVVTANHVTKIDVPDGKTRSFRGAVASRYTQRYDLFEVPAVAVSADIALLRFSPAIPQKWQPLKIRANHVFHSGDKITAIGFPLGKEIETRPGAVSNLLGPKASIGVNVGLAPGMSGGPVILSDTLCVVGVVAGGSGYPNFDYFTPTQLAKSLLEVPPAEFVTDISRRESGNDVAAALSDRSYRVDQTKDDHSGTATSKYYDFAFDAEADTKIVQARLVEESANAASDKAININAERTKATFRFKLESGPIYDQWRGWWHGQVILTQQKSQPQTSSTNSECK